MRFLDFAAKVVDQRKREGIRGAGREASRYRCHVAPCAFADKAIADVSARDIRDWLKWMQEKTTQDHREARPLTRHTIQRSQSLVSAIFAEAVDQELISSNPCAGVKMKKRTDASGTKKRWAYFTPDEQRKLTTCGAIPLADRLLIKFAIGSGMRQGELFYLHIDDLRLDTNEIVVRYGSRGLPPKSGKIREVPLFGLALDAAREWLPLLETYARENPERLVFPTQRGRARQQGKPFGPSNVFHRYCDLAGVKRTRFHDLRHTCASSLVAGWWGRQWQLIEVRDMLGHSSTNVTEMYAHLGQTSLKAAAAATVVPVETRPETSLALSFFDRVRAAFAQVAS